MPNLEIQSEQTKLDQRPCVILRMPDGATRLVRSGEPYRLQPGEQVAGVDRGCGSPISKPFGERKPISLAQELSQEIGTGMGDWIKVLAKPVAKLVGKENCSPCEAKRIVVNAYGQLKYKHGKLGALSIINALWSKAAKGDPEGALADLKAHLAE